MGVVRHGCLRFSRRHCASKPTGLLSSETDKLRVSPCIGKMGFGRTGGDKAWSKPCTIVE